MPLIDGKNNLIFIHVPKCAGTSVRKVFDFEPNKKINEGFAVNSHHARPVEIKNIHINEWNKCKKFITVRHPLDRFVSAFFHFKRFQVLKENNFSNFVKIFYTNPKEAFDMKVLEERRNFSNTLNFIDPISEWYDDEIDFVIRFETLDSDINKMCESLGIEKRKLPKTNSTKHAKYTEYYDKESEYLVRKNFKQDFERFGYK